jgi:drug/metabolite transporter (DMT)-like permease
MEYLLLGLSIALSTGRNILSKRLSRFDFGTAEFFLCQGLLFSFGGVAVLAIKGLPQGGVSASTVGYALIYGIILILAQWFYTAALAKGNTSLCSTVYSLGFILPTVSGAILWSESLSVLDGVGIVCAALAVIASGRPTEKGKGVMGNRYFIPLIIAMLASGGLGILQKLQQRSAYAEQKAAFLLIAFLLAAATSFIFAAITVATRSRSRTVKTARLRPAMALTAALIGLFFGCCNFLNTTLAGMLPTSVFFPTLNIGIILLTMLMGILFFKERVSKRELAVLSFGIAAILLLNL